VDEYFENQNGPNLIDLIKDQNDFLSIMPLPHIDLNSYKSPLDRFYLLNSNKVSNIRKSLNKADELQTKKPSTPKEGSRVNLENIKEINSESKVRQTKVDQKP